MTGRALSVDELSAAEDYRRVSREADDEAGKLHLGFSTLYALLDSNLATREEILLRIQRIGGGPIDDSEQAVADLEHRMGEALEYLGSLSTSARNRSSDAAKMTAQIEDAGLRD